MGSNSVKAAPDAQTDVSTVPPSLLYNPPISPSSDTSLTVDTGPAPEEQIPTSPERFAEGWGTLFSQAMGEIQQASSALDQMHSQLQGLLPSGPDEPRLLDSALSWETRLSEVRKGLKSGLQELCNLKRQYEAVSAGHRPIPVHETAGDTQEPPEERGRRTPPQEERMEDSRLTERVRHLEAENLTLAQRVTQLQGEVQDLTLLQSDLRTAVSVAERFREEAQEKLERSERDGLRLRTQGLDRTDWPENSALQGYCSLPRGVILSTMRDSIVKSSSLMSVPPRCSRAPDSDTARRERRGSLETLLDAPRAITNLTEDSGSFLRRYGGSKRGVFLRWAQERTYGYKHVVITNFSSSWADGMALCALLHSYLPERVPYSQLRPLEKRKNLQLAFQVAESVGIPPLLTADHMLQPQGPDWQKVLLHVESIYQKFEA